MKASVCNSRTVVPEFSSSLNGVNDLSGVVLLGYLRRTPGFSVPSLFRIFTLVPITGLSLDFTPLCREYAKPLSDSDHYYPLITWIIAWDGITHSFRGHTIPIPRVVAVMNNSK